MKLIKLIFNSGKHIYKEVPEEVIFKMKRIVETESRPLVINYDGKRFHPFELTEEIPTFEEVDAIEIKIAKVFISLLKCGNNKYAEKILVASDVTIENIIESVGIPRNNPRLQKIKEIKDQESISSKDREMIKVLWWEAKRDSFIDLAQKMNVDTPPQQRMDSTLNEVKKELDKRITKAIQDFNSFPEVRQACDTCGCEKTGEQEEDEEEEKKIKTAVLIQKVNPKTDKKEWALVSKDKKKVLKYFGPKKPNEEKVKKEEKRIQFFKIRGKSFFKNKGKSK